jgi:hypothetical protein
MVDWSQTVMVKGYHRGYRLPLTFEDLCGHYQLLRLRNEHAGLLLTSDMEVRTTD